MGFPRKFKIMSMPCPYTFMDYNFGAYSIHKALRVTPAMQAGVAVHVWTLEEIAKLTD